MSFSRLSLSPSKWLELVLATVIIPLVWLYLWYFPWQDKIHHVFWLQLGIGLTVFIVPGLCVYGLVNDHPNFRVSHVTFGFVISHLIFALLGTLGRSAHLPFEAIKNIMMALGLILLLCYTLPIICCGIKFQRDKEQSSYFLSILPILVVSLPVILIVIRRVLTDDDLTYLAFITNIQHSVSLNFNDPVFSGTDLASPRFWLMSIPFAQALLVEISRVPGILILSGHYEPFLVILSVLCWYELAIALKLSPRAASASVILHLGFLLLLSEYLNPGAPYFDQLSVDKATAAFIASPVFIQSLINLLETSTRKNEVLFLLTGLSLALMHPIIMAYSFFIGGMLILLHKSDRGLKSKLIPVLILVIFLIPQVVLRFIRIPSAEPISYDPEVVLARSGSDNLVARWENTPYYGFNPEILTMKFPYEANIPLPKPILEFGWVILPIFAVLFSLKRRDAVLAQFILSGFILCFLTGLPLTGWIFGYFLNARMLARSVWLFPFGVSTIYVIFIIRDHFNAVRINRTRYKHPFTLSTGALTLLTMIMIGLFVLYMRENGLPNFEKFTSKTQRYQGLVMAGQELDQRISDHAFVMGSPSINDLIPAVSQKSRLITFRNSSQPRLYFTSKEWDERIADTGKIFSRSIPAEIKMSLLRKYGVQFLLLQRNDIQLFIDLIANYPDNIRVSDVDGMIIMEME